MKKKGRSGTAGEEIAGGHYSSDPWRRASWNGGGCGQVKRVEEERVGMMAGGGGA